MLWKFLTAFGLMAICVAIHAAGITWPMRRLDRQLVIAPLFLAWTRRFIRLASWIILLHLIEISVWGALYVWQQAIPSPEDAWYFSAVTYTTVGYGDLVPPQGWRLAAGVEGLTGILMCGWSAAYFFTVVNRMQREH